MPDERTAPGDDPADEGDCGAVALWHLEERDHPAPARQRQGKPTSPNCQSFSQLCHYNESEKVPVFWEIKRRMKDVVILELKFTERFPQWYNELVQAFDLTQSGAAKYLEGSMMYAGRQLDAPDVVRTMVM